MNREKAKLIVPLLAAFAEGKDIQCRFKNGPTDEPWKTADNPGWHTDVYEYRIKPEVSRPDVTECWAVWLGSEFAYGSPYVHFNRVDAEKALNRLNTTGEAKIFYFKRVFD